MHRALIGLAALALPVMAFAQAQPYSTLTGKLTITGAEAVDPPPGQKNDRAGLFLTGDSARRVYDAMTAKPTNGDACEKGMKLKKAGGLVCASHAGASYSCSVAIVLTTGETKPFGAC